VSQASFFDFPLSLPILNPSFARPRLHFSFFDLLQPSFWQLQQLSFGPQSQLFSFLLKLFFVVLEFI
jgi:hypothetical protein